MLSRTDRYFQAWDPSTQQARVAVSSVLARSLADLRSVSMGRTADEHDTSDRGRRQEWRKPQSLAYETGRARRESCSVSGKASAHDHYDTHFEGHIRYSRRHGN